MDNKETNDKKQDNYKSNWLLILIAAIIAFLWVLWGRKSESLVLGWSAILFWGAVFIASVSFAVKDFKHGLKKEAAICLTAIALQAFSLVWYIISAVENLLSLFG